MNGLWSSIFMLAALAVAAPIQASAESVRLTQKPPRTGGAAAARDTAGVLPPPPPPPAADAAARKLLEQDLPSRRSLLQYGCYDCGSYDATSYTDYVAFPDNTQAPPDLPPPVEEDIYGDYGNTYGGYADSGSPPAGPAAPAAPQASGVLAPSSSASFADATNEQLQLAADVAADQLALIINGKAPSREITAAVHTISKHLLSSSSLLPPPEVIISALVEALNSRVSRGSDDTINHNKSPVKTKFCIHHFCIYDIPVSVEAIASAP